MHEKVRRSTRRLLAVVLPAVLYGAVLSPAAADIEPQLLKQRKLFQDAEHALKLGRVSEYRRLAGQLQDYPLYPYLQYSEIQRDLSRADDKTVHRFVQDYPDTPLASRLQYLWLKSLARKKQWRSLVENFYYTTDIALQCDYVTALLNVQETERAHAVLAGLWLTGQSLPNNCDAPIEAWHQAGALSQELVWERIRLAMQARRTTLALYLARYLPEAEQYWVRVWAKVRRDPDYVMQVYDRFQDNDSQTLRWVLSEGLRHMARDNPAHAAQLWHLWRTQFKFSPQEQVRIERRLTLALVKADPRSGKRWMNELELDADDNRINQLYIINAMQDQDWDTSLEWLNRLDDEEKHSDRWRYWRGRALEGQGQLEEARAVYLLIADTRSYYGFLSADRAGMGYRFDHRPVPNTSKDLSAIEQVPGILRARELLAINRVVDARREWQHTLQGFDKTQLLCAAQLAHQWDWHDRAIITLAQAEYWDDLEKRFPLAHQTSVMNYARQQQINPAWAFAIIRQESAFTDDARSHAGAMGLMQLLPSTARQVARSLRLRFSHNDLLNADTNVRLGINYLRKVSDRFKGNKVLATAAYNAGGHRVSQWLPSEGILPADVWIESVPFHETRDYLKRVLTYTVIYEQRLGQQPVSLLERMLPIPGAATVISSDDRQKPRDAS